MPHLPGGILEPGDEGRDTMTIDLGPAFPDQIPGCPMGGNHDVQNVIWIWIDKTDPRDPHLGAVVDGRACIRCGLRDTFILEGDPEEDVVR